MLKKIWNASWRHLCYDFTKIFHFYFQKNRDWLIICNIILLLTFVLETDFSSKLPKKNSFKMTNLKEERIESTELKIQAAGGGESSGSDSDKDLKTSSTSSVSSSSSGTTSKLALRMADKVSLGSSPAEKRFKFEPNEDYLDQLLAMGISNNGAKKVRKISRQISLLFVFVLTRGDLTRFFKMSTKYWISGLVLHGES